MGIRLLNRLITKYSKNGIFKKTLLCLRDKVVVIDISIYMYKYASADCLIENLYLLFTTLQYYNIKPICVFDGYAPKEKSAELKSRAIQKRDATKNYEELKYSLNDIHDKKMKQRIKKLMNELKRKIVVVTKDDRLKVKELLNYLGVCYYQADGEADKLCAKLVIDGDAYACLSEDMDLFVYGCPRVLRYISLKNHTVIMYDMVKILDDLSLTSENFCKMCILSGTDYNRDVDNRNIFYNYNTYRGKEGGILLNENEEHIYNMFNVENYDVSKDKFINNSSIDMENLKIFLKEYGFIFIN